ncbi:HIT-like domain-containing protein [Lasiosphaeria miniovina]|uniref:HIT-like domain-containing protein n=1 Tax=Lasiosphaeria miniovina TaxID=1954250 RepID=A0AA40AKV9_9PEZI|nr:HIT-like domain-containing protein [Lasiosphaeria miniovina]KAK0717715.1 HIT-like domain-containing protein [Lasiosphaeria miniovina]
MSPHPSAVPLLAPKNLPELVRTAFNRARASGDVNFYPTQAAVLDLNSVPFQLRFAPSLANKPKGPPPRPPQHNAPPSPARPFDPFDNPPTPLLVTGLGASHILVLNKFAVVPEHAIVATRAFARQTHLLAPADLAAVYACIDAYDSEGGQLFAFFNSGTHSGASQAHRHIQLLPVERMRDGLPDTHTSSSSSSSSSGGGDGETGDTDAAVEWADVLASSLLDETTRARLPFQTFAHRIRNSGSPAPDADALHAAYLALYNQACAAVSAHDHHDIDGIIPEEGEARISYNLAMTRDVMVVVPRLAEGGEITVPSSPASAGGGGGATPRKTVGKLALNGTVLAGTALVKSAAEWHALRQDPGQVLDILRRIGVPWGEDGPSSSL